jgi:hypothetical protein
MKFGPKVCDEIDECVRLIPDLDQALTLKISMSPESFAPTIRLALDRAMDAKNRSDFVTARRENIILAFLVTWSEKSFNVVLEELENPSVCAEVVSSMSWEMDLRDDPSRVRDEIQRNDAEAEHAVASQLANALKDPSTSRLDLASIIVEGLYVSGAGFLHRTEEKDADLVERRFPYLRLMLALVGGQLNKAALKLIADCHYHTLRQLREHERVSSDQFNQAITVIHLLWISAAGVPRGQVFKVVTKSLCEESR